MPETELPKDLKEQVDQMIEQDQVKTTAENSHSIADNLKNNELKQDSEPATEVKNPENLETKKDLITTQIEMAKKENEKAENWKQKFKRTGTKILLAALVVCSTMMPLQAEGAGNVQPVLAELARNAVRIYIDTIMARADLSDQAQVQLTQIKRRIESAEADLNTQYEMALDIHNTEIKEQQIKLDKKYDEAKLKIKNEASEQKNALTTQEILIGKKTDPSLTQQINSQEAKKLADLDIKYKESCDSIKDKTTQFDKKWQKIFKDFKYKAQKKLNDTGLVQIEAKENLELGARRSQRQNVENEANNAANVIIK